MAISEKGNKSNKAKITVQILLKGFRLQLFIGKLLNMIVDNFQIFYKK